MNLPLDAFGRDVVAVLAALRTDAGMEISSEWLQKLWQNIWDPWFAFGMVAQAVFFLRFVVQWIVSERRKRSTIPIAFWYLSLAGGLLTFVYACKKADPVFMLGQLLACIIYVRNLMLIYGRRDRRQARMERPAGTERRAPREAENGLTGPPDD